MKRRVCFVAPFGLGQKTTVWARTLPLARALVEHGWTPTLLIPPWDTPADAGRAWADHGVELVNVQIAGGVPLTTRRLLHEISVLAPEIVHIVKPRAHAGLVQWWLWQRRRIRRRTPCLLLDADDWEQAWAPINGYTWPLARFLAWQEEWGIRHADGITAASRWLVERIHRANRAAPILHLPNGIEPQPADGLRWTPTHGNDILFFSRFVEVAPFWLATCWRALHARRPQARLLVAGAPVRADLGDAFRGAMASIAPHAASHVEWLGYVDQARLAEIYARIGCAIFPAEPTVLQQAKCSVRLATTLLAGAPVVASAVGEQRAYGAGGAARLVPANATPEVFAEAVDALLNTPAQQASISEAARRRLQEQYDWRLLGERLHEFYEEVLRRDQ